MDRRLLDYYQNELDYIRAAAGEFAREFPRQAHWLAPENLDVVDPYIERLLEGFAFLTARINLKIDSEFPRFTQGMLQTVYPQLLSPTPSMAVVQFTPRPGERSTGAPVLIPRDSVLRSVPVGRHGTRCEYRTALPVEVWPLEIREARYYARDLGLLGLPNALRARAALRLRIATVSGQPIKELKQLSSLSLYLRGDAVRMRLYAALCARSLALCAEEPGQRAARWRETSRETIRPVGFDSAEALLPEDSRTFSGYRLMREYFAMPERFLFVKMGGLERFINRCDGPELDLIVPFTEADTSLEGAVRATNFALSSSPAANLFAMDADRILLSSARTEFPVIPDRSRPMDFEVYRVDTIAGFGASAAGAQEFNPFYAARAGNAARARSYFDTQRVPLRTTNGIKSERTTYQASEVFVSLVDADHAPISSDLKQLAVRTLCTNRDLPLLIPVAASNFGVFSSEQRDSLGPIRCLTGPTAPIPAPVTGDTSWQLISHLALNYLSLVDGVGSTGANTLRNMLRLYVTERSAADMQIDALIGVASRPITRRVRGPGPVVFARGVEVALTFDESGFEGRSPYLLAAVLERFLSGSTSINSFTETVLATTDRGAVSRWPARSGTRALL